MQLVNSLWAASALAAIVGAIVNTILKSAFRAECVDGLTPTNHISLHSAATACVVVAALNVTIHIALLVSRPLSKRGCALFGALFSNWTVQYFIFVSLQQMSLTAVVTNAVLSGQVDGPCSFTEDALADAAAQMRHFAVVVIGLSVMCSDIDDTFSPAMRRCVYCIYALFTASDAIGSFVLGNALATGVKLSLKSFKFAIETQITSCIAAQTLMAFHFVFVSLRSSDGRAWAYERLRFDLQEDATSSQQLRPTTGRTALLRPIAADILQSQDQDSDSALFCMRLSLLTFQRQQFSKCQVFIIPCDAGRDVLRPLFNLPYLRRLHRIADTHPFVYFGVVSLIGFCSIVSTVLQNLKLLSSDVSGLLSLVLNFFATIGFIGFLSSKRNNIDKVAAKRVVSSFRFVYCAALVICWIAHDIRDTYLGERSVLQLAATLFVMLLFFLSLLEDCSPRLSPVVQFLISVSYSLFTLVPLHRHHHHPIHACSDRL